MQITPDIIHFAIGKDRRKSRNSKNWVNHKQPWTFFVKKLSETVYTLETYKEYIKLGETKEGKEEQANIKDRGSFVGAYLKEGKRHPANVIFRQILTLDIDYAPYDFWDHFTTFYDCEGLIHSTHKHSPETPRYRLVIPLSRHVSREQYEAIARKVAGDLDINMFDPTTFQPERLMYWPTTSKDGEFIFKYQKGTFLDADDILGSYYDWKDISSWPRPEAEKENITNGLKQSSPSEKPGLVGAFCRKFDIKDVINEFLHEVYEPASTDDRMTFKKGSTAAGAIIYGQNEFLYSHHSTDPGSGKLLNAFDLVRVHKFSAEDAGHENDTIIKRPSYRLMCDFARAIPDVVKQLAVVNIPEEDFDGMDYDRDWLGQLTVDKFGKYEETITNFKLIIMNDPGLKDRLKFDEFYLRDTAFRPLPWDTKTVTKEDGQNIVKHWVSEFTDIDDSALRGYIEKKYSIYHVAKIKDAASTIFFENRYHPVKDYLQNLKWDGVKRIETLLIDYLGAEDTKFNREAMRKTLVAAVARIYKPGCKFDYVLTLIGKQGIKKSTFYAYLGRQWFSDSFLGVEGNKAFEQLQGCWILEMGEMAAMKKADVEAVKHFISKKIDAYRMPYAKRNSYIKRQSIIVASTNENSPLKDYTGNRRFWPVKVDGYGMLEMEDMPVNQVWAEAITYYKAGEKLYFDDITIEEMANEMQKEHTERDDREGIITAYVDMLLPERWAKMSIVERRNYVHSSADDFTGDGELKRQSLCVAEVWCELFKGELRDMNTFNTKYIHNILSNLPGWQKNASNLSFPIYGKQRTYVRNTANLIHHDKRKVK